ncbi:diatom phytochrome 1 [Nitzschia inconspicua]|uniref:histidine kinase n=1 Tax=Nitzschia inconspicua TaxID=303405 RepID=A0A9K3PNR6_9STRA|nr:diatom phytochrome 1 [Nitzschia inconspicua]
MGGIENVSIKRLGDSITDMGLTECDREKIHFLQHIQADVGHVLFFSFPEGKILATDTKIRQAVPWFQYRGRPEECRSSVALSTDGEDNENGEAAHGASTNISLQSAEVQSLLEDVLGSSLISWVPYSCYKQIYEALEEMKKGRSQRSFLFFCYKKRSYAISLSTTKLDMSIIGMEIELIDESEAADGFYDTLVSLGRVMDLHADEKIVNFACDTVFRLLGAYDRGMVYKFYDDLSGQIIHEIKKSDSDIQGSFVEMRYPAGDIPLSARKLFIKNGLRYIRNVEGDEVQIVDQLGGDIDLSHCRMRACTKSHLLYMKNMGVKCSMSIAIVADSQLWGLLIFHGYTEPFKPSLHQRIACETINSMISVKVEAMQKQEQSTRLVELSKCLIKWRISASVANNIKEIGPEILKLFGADVLVGWFKDPSTPEAELVVVGDKALVPSVTFWSVVSQQPLGELQIMNTRAEIDTTRLSETDCPASSVIYYRDTLFQVMVGRGLNYQDVRWAGNPYEPILRLDGSLRPRSSFDLYMEKGKRESKRWSQSDLHVLRRFIRKTAGYAHNRMMVILRSEIEESNVKYMNELNKARENHEFFSQIAHEIRTPFHGVMGCLNIIEEGRDEMSSAEVKDLLNTALTSGSHMTNLLDNILQIAMNKYLSHSLKFESFDYHSLASEIAQSLKSLALKNHVKFNAEILPKKGSIRVKADRTKVIQIVSNLINNAIKFAPGGNIEIRFQLIRTLRRSIHMWTEDASKYDGLVFSFGEKALFTTIRDVQHHVAQLPESEENKWILVSVKDSGCGMQPNEIKEMLKPYTQTQDGTNATIQGTGLGLFICVSLCHQMDGFLACSSTYGSGTVFHVGIPVGDAKEAKENCDITSEHTAQESAFSSEEIPICGPILVCDDNSVNRKILNRSLALQLKNFGLDIKILEADGGEKCVELYKKERPSVLFIDYNMPQVDGLEATKRIRNYEAEHSSMRSYIISYTADVTEKTANLLRSNGTNEIMSKPPPKGFLSSVVGRFWLQGRSTMDFASLELPSPTPHSAANQNINEVSKILHDTAMGDETAHKKRTYQQLSGKPEKMKK